MKFTKETLKRASRTFIQAALAYFSVNLAYVSFTDDKVTVQNAIVGLVVSAVASGVAAVMNLEEVDGND